MLIICSLQLDMSTKARQRSTHHKRVSLFIVIVIICQDLFYTHCKLFNMLPTGNLSKFLIWVKSYLNGVKASLLFLDYSTGFGGRYGVQKDRQDKVDIFVFVSFITVPWC